MDKLKFFNHVLKFLSLGSHLHAACVYSYTKSLLHTPRETFFPPLLWGQCEKNDIIFLDTSAQQNFLLLECPRNIVQLVRILMNKVGELVGVGIASPLVSWQPAPPPEPLNIMDQFMFYVLYVFLYIPWFHLCENGKDTCLKPLKGQRKGAEKEPTIIIILFYLHLWQSAVYDFVFFFHILKSWWPNAVWAKWYSSGLFCWSCIVLAWFVKTVCDMVLMFLKKGSGLLK